MDIRGCLQSCTETKPGPKAAKQESSVINCALLALLKKIKGKKVQSSDRLLGQGLDGGLLSAPKGQQGGEEEEEEDSPEVSTDRC